MTGMFVLNTGLLKLFTSVLTGTFLSKEDFAPETGPCLFIPSSVDQLAFRRKTNAGFVLL